MSAKKAAVTILSLGGSLIVPDDGPDIEFLRRFTDLINRRVSRGEKFAIITGGGKVCRKYQAAVATLHPVTTIELDWLGIEVTRLNANLVRMIFGETAHSKIIENPTLPISFRKPVVIGAGWKPGCSTDQDAVLLAENIGAKTVINLSNTDYIYDSDPKINSQAKPLKRLTWNELQRMFGSKWRPGLNSPFDPVASKVAQRLGLRVITTNGRDLENLERIMNGNDDFRGSVIE